MKFKVGDKVRFKSMDEMIEASIKKYGFVKRSQDGSVYLSRKDSKTERFGIGFFGEPNERTGKTFTVSRIDMDDPTDSFPIKEWIYVNNSPYRFPEEWFVSTLEEKLDKILEE